MYVFTFQTRSSGDTLFKCPRPDSNFQYLHDRYTICLTRSHHHHHHHNRNHQCVLGSEERILCVVVNGSLLWVILDVILICKHFRTLECFTVVIDVSSQFCKNEYLVECNNNCYIQSDFHPLPTGINLFIQTHLPTVKAYFVLFFIFVEFCVLYVKVKTTTTQNCNENKQQRQQQQQQQQG
uniref:Uncharacterized protein n=1 Tax=Glossina pallidipes TaxID=7398 RepID=A0A1B0A2A7_GLOPL